jgi:hypothetical protein
MEVLSAVEPDRLGQVDVLCLDDADRTGHACRG